MPMSKFTAIVAAVIGFCAVDPALAADRAEVSLLPNEVPLRVVGKGKSLFPADQATLTLNIKCSGETAAKARALVTSRTNEIVADLVKRGIPRVSITVSDGPSGIGFVGNEAVIEDVMQLEDTTAPATPKRKKQATTSIEVVLTNLALLPSLRQFLDEREAVFLDSPSLDLRDDRAARRAAIDDAIRNARVEAEAYAAATNMRVSRLLAINDMESEGSIMGQYGDLMRKMMARTGQSSSDKIETNVSVNVGFALVPR